MPAPRILAAVAATLLLLLGVRGVAKADGVGPGACRFEEIEVPLYERRLVPAFAERRVPVWRDEEVPVRECRRVTITKECCDPVTGRIVTVPCGWKTEWVVTGTRTERRFAGWRTERIPCGTRWECMKVGTRTVRRPAPAGG